jgi:tetratricopeptide (TPR) repeat protein
MFVLKKLILLAAVIIIAVLCVLIYWNQHLYYKAENIGDSKTKIEILEKASTCFPINDLVFYDLGKAFLDLGMNSIGEEARSSIHLQKSIGQFNRSLKINPTSYFGRFYLAQSFQHMSFSSPLYEEKAYEEYKKAARLAGENTEIFFEVGRIFLSQWQILSQEDKDFTIEILKKIVNSRKRDRLLSVFYLWEVNVEDYEVINEILSEDPLLYREFAEFLGEKSLSLEERHRYLAEAELLEFQRAQEIFDAGEHAYFYYRLDEAQDRFKNCLNSLDKIHFYQDLLDSEKLIDLSEYSKLQRLALLHLVKAILEQGKELEDVGGYLWDYLEKEDRAIPIGELESYLRGRGLDGETADSSFVDLDSLSFKVYLSLKQGRFKDNMRIGRNLLKSFVNVPEGKETQFVRVLQIVGESFQKGDFLYDSNDFFDKALDLDPGNLEVLVKLRNNYERLSAEREIRDANRKIDEIISPRDVGLDRFVYKGRKFRRSLILDGRKINLGLQFGESQDDRGLLVAVFFNGRVVWEEYLKQDTVSVSVESKVGENVIEVLPVSRGIELLKITYE